MDGEKYNSALEEPHQGFDIKSEVMQIFLLPEVIKSQCKLFKVIRVTRFSGLLVAREDITLSWYLPNYLGATKHERRRLRAPISLFNEHICEIK